MVAYSDLVAAQSPLGILLNLLQLRGATGLVGEQGLLRPYRSARYLTDYA